MMMLCLMFFIAATGGAAAEPEGYTWGPVRFQASVILSQPQEIGRDAAALVYPADAALGQTDIEITLALASPGMKSTLEMNDVDLFAYLKTTFMGLGGPPQKSVTRTFLGRAVTGERHDHTIPRPSAVEVYCVPLSDGGSLLVGFTFREGFDPAAAEALMDAVASSMKEVQQP